LKDVAHAVIPKGMVFYFDLPLEEVAAALGTSVAAARGRVYRACRRLPADPAVEAP
jgi:DNA-directed RNA polymerase specialized sigma24 family protein